jgi:small-conductance mechanosensitive channel
MLNDDDILFGYDYKYRNTEASIFREAIEGMTTTTTKDGKATTKSGEFVGADTESAEKKKKSPCATDCSQYVELKGKINDLSKYVNLVKDQTAEIKQTSDKLQELGKQIQDLNKSLSPGGQVQITM